MTLSAAQLAMRMTGIGSSEISDLVLGNGMRTFLRKTGQAEEETQAPTLQGRNPRGMGHRIEPVIAQMYAEETGARVYVPEEPTVRHSKHKLALATPDRLAAFQDLTIVLEAKAPGLRMAPMWDNGVPEGFQLQATWLCGVLDLPRCDVAALIGGQDFRIYPQEARPADFAGLVEIAERFWTDHVEKREPPPVDGSDEWSDFIARRWPSQKKGKVLRPDADDNNAIAELREVKARLKLDKEREAALRNTIALKMGDAEAIEGLCTYRWQNGSTYTVTKKPGRVLRLASED